MDLAPVTAEHLSGYQARDRNVIDYRMYELDGTGLQFRGPRDDAAVANPTVVCVGAAQTYGCFVEQPYPALLADALNAPVLNLGYGGAGPGFFARRPDLLRLLNTAEIAVIQVMSGRSASNSLYESGGLEYLRRRSDGERLSADAAYRELVFGRRLADEDLSIHRRVARRGTAAVRRRRIASVVGETRATWSDDYRRLFEAIEVPVVLAWISVRAPDRTDDLSTPGRLLGEFPQLVNREMVSELVPLVEAYVECVTDRGLPQPLFSRETGEPTTVDPAHDRPDLGGRLWTHNTYYPSPEMHRDLVTELLPVCRSLLS